MNSILRKSFTARSFHYQKVLNYVNYKTNKHTEICRPHSTDSHRNVSFIGRDFLTLKNFKEQEIHKLLWTAADLKYRFKKENEVYRPLDGKSVSMIFQKRSTRTRMSTETGTSLLGGHACFLGPADIHLGVSESVPDTARVLSRFSDAILARVYEHTDIETLADYAGVPVINGLSDMYHPLQILADLVTIQEHFGYLRMLTIAWVGDGNNNMTHSFMMACPKMGINLRIACPNGYEPDSKVMGDAAELCAKHKTELKVTHNPKEAVYRADVIITDTFVSMGREDEKEKRLADFAGFQVDRKLVQEARANWAFLHCLPRKSEEVTDDVFNDPKHSLVWEEAENRKWTVMAVLLHVLKDHTPKIAQPNYGYKPDSK